MPDMCDYKLYYWQAPFRGNFVQLLLEEIGCKYERLDASEIYPDRSLKVNFPGMAPPYLYDCKTKRYHAQMPAIMMYLGEKHGLLPKNPDERYLVLKTVCDCHDVLLEITNCYGEKMWTPKTWREFRERRFAKWLQIFEKTVPKIKNGIANVAVTALLGPLLYTFPELEKDVRKNAPRVLALFRRIERRPRIAKLLAKQREEWGDIYCGGQIEKSLRKMIKG